MHDGEKELSQLFFEPRIPVGILQGAFPVFSLKIQVHGLSLITSLISGLAERNPVDRSPGALLDWYPVDRPVQWRPAAVFVVRIPVPAVRTGAAGPVQGNSGPVDR